MSQPITGRTHTYMSIHIEYGTLSRLILFTVFYFYVDKSDVQNII